MLKKMNSFADNKQDIIITNENHKESRKGKAFIRKKEKSKPQFSLSFSLTRSSRKSLTEEDGEQDGEGLPHHGREGQERHSQVKGKGLEEDLGQRRVHSLHRRRTVRGGGQEMAPVA